MIGTSCCKQGCGLGRDQTRHWQPGVATNRSSLDLDRHQNSRQITSTAQSAHILASTQRCTFALPCWVSRNTSSIILTRNPTITVWRPRPSLRQLLPMTLEIYTTTRHRLHKLDHDHIKHMLALRCWEPHELLLQDASARREMTMPSVPSMVARSR